MENFLLSLVMSSLSVVLEKKKIRYLEKDSTQLTRVFRMVHVLVDATDADTGTARG